MKPLTTNHQVMIWLCMCPADESASKKKRMIYVAFTFIVIAITVLCLLSCIVFIVKYLATDLESCLYVVFQVFAQTSILNEILVGLFMRHQIGAIFTKLSRIYIASKGQDYAIKYHKIIIIIGFFVCCVIMVKTINKIVKIIIHFIKNHHQIGSCGHVNNDKNLY